MARLAVGGVVLAAVAAALVAPGDADAAARVSASYGVLAKRTVHATATVTGAGRRARVLLETRQGRRGKARVRQAKALRRGAAKLRWRHAKGAKRVTVRVRVVRQRGKRRTLAKGRWKTLQVAKAKAAAPVEVVKPSTVVAVPVPGLPGELVLKRRSGVNRGDVVVMRESPATPDGLLVKAVGVTRSGGVTRVSTQPATLPEAVPVGELDLQIPAGARTAAAPLQRLQSALECTNGRSATATGEASVSAGLSLSTKWHMPRLFSLPKVTARFSGNVNATVNAAASISGEADCTMDRQALFAAPVRLHSFATSIGPVPVVGNVYGQIYLSGSATASGRIEASANASAGASAGVEYDGERFKPFGRLDKSFTVNPPVVSASGSIQASLAPAVDVRFYGVGGPEIDFSAGLKLAADVNPAPGEPWWRVTAPLEAGVRLRLNAWRLALESERFSIWNEELELLRASTPPGGSSISDLGPSPEPLPAGIRTRLVWDSTSDVDLHTWDELGAHAYFADLFGIESGYLDQDVIPGYGPETFFETTPGNAFTFGVCQYSGTQANVIVDVRDPDGHTRRFSVTLRGRKAASLLTTSPPGTEPYVPTETWCNHDGVDPAGIGQTTTGSFDAFGAGRREEVKPGADAAARRDQPVSGA
jgi:hypothetical protein